VLLAINGRMPLVIAKPMFVQVDPVSVDMNTPAPVPAKTCEPLTVRAVILLVGIPAFAEDQLAQLLF
jgi:hypothetical protein